MLSSLGTLEARWKLAAGAAGIALIAVFMRRNRKVRDLRGVVTDLHRFAVKGLERDTLSSCALKVSDCFPADRMWALMREDKLSEFNPQKPEWIHKMSFYAACSAGMLLTRLNTSYDDATMTLKIRDRQSGKHLLEARLGEEFGRSEAENFFSALVQEEDVQENGGVCPPRVRIVRAETLKPHQFGNTSSGVSATGDTRTIHLVNKATVRELSQACGEEIDVLRFRGNILLDGLPAWEEFKWVGRCIAVGPDVRMRVIKRTVRCAATSYDLHTASPAQDVPGLLQKFFPEHGPYLGVYAQVVRGGSISCGDVVRPLWSLW